MAEQDIVKETNGKVTATKYAVAIEITRNGTGKSGWRISWPCAENLVLPDGSSVQRPCASVSFDFDDLAHDADVANLYQILRDVTIRVLRGDLKQKDAK